MCLSIVSSLLTGYLIRPVFCQTEPVLPNDYNWIGLFYSANKFASDG